MVYMEMGNLIKYYRQKEKWTQKELARGICSVSYLSKIENGMVEPSNEILELICRRLKIDLTQTNAEDDEKLEKMLYQWHRHIQHQDRKSADHLYREIKPLISHSSNHQCEILFHLFLFRYHLFTSDLDKARTIFQELRQMEDLLNAEYSFYYYKFSGIFFLKTDKLDQSMTCMRKAEETYRTLHFNDPELFFYLSMIYSKKQELNRGIIYAQQALEMYQDMLFYERITDCHLLLGIQYNNLGEFDIAEDYLTKLLPKKTSHFQRSVLPKVYHNLGYIYFNRKNYHQALTYLEKALILKKNHAEKINTLFLIASSYHALNERNKALGLVQEGMELAERHRNQKYMYKFYILKQKINHTLFDETFIFNLKTNILSYFEESGEKSEYKDIVKLLGDIYFQKRQYKNAASIYQKLYT